MKQYIPASMKTKATYSGLNSLRVQIHEGVGVKKKLRDTVLTKFRKQGVLTL